MYDTDLIVNGSCGENRRERMKLELPHLKRAVRQKRLGHRSCSRRVGGENEVLRLGTRRKENEEAMAKKGGVRTRLHW